MFGNNSADNQSSSTTTTSDSLASLTPSSTTPVFGVDTSSQTPIPEPSISSDGTLTTSVPSDTPTSSDSDNSDVTPPAPAMSESSPSNEPTLNKPSDDLMELKKDALAKLGPLVDKLDQSPEEKFKTTMMMIQASDDKSLIPKAYEAASSISDEKTKAQALLDIINEINYFTSDKKEEASL